MKVLVLGSLKHLTNEEDCNNFRLACKAIGKRLNECGHTIIVGSDSEATADRYVVEGAASIRRRHNIIVYYSDDPAEEPGDVKQTEVPYSQPQNIVVARIQRRFIRGPWIVAHTAAAREADVVIVIGGRRRCDVVGAMIPALQRPILAIPLFGGSAKTIWSELHAAYARCGISNDEFENISVRWTEASARSTESVARKICRKNPFKQQGQWPRIGAALVGVGCICAWVASFSLASREAVGINVAFFTMCALCSIAGTTLRLLWHQSHEEEVAEFDFVALYMEFARALITSFGFVLTYLIGSFVYTGSLKQLANSDEFVRVSIFFSLIGFAASYLIEPTTKELERRLARVVSRRSSSGSLESRRDRGRRGG